MQKSQKLPLNALQTFEVLVRHEKLSEAARELNVSESAVSHQIKTLEAWFGQSLFDRSRRALRPSREAMRLAYVIEQSFLDIREACNSLLDNNLNNTLEISCSAAFSSIVLLPLLRRFYESNPDIEITLKLERYSDPTNDADLFIRFADRASAGVLENKIGPTGWQCIVAKNAPFSRAQNDDFVPNRTNVLAESFDNPWNEFLEVSGRELRLQDMNVLHYSEMNLVCAATISGEGYAIVPRLLAKQLCRQAMVRPVTDTIIRPNSMYYYVYPEGATANKRHMRNQFIAWLSKEVS